MPGPLILRLGDYSERWYQLRGRGATLVTADDTPLVLTTPGCTTDWDNKPAEPVEPKVSGFDFLNCVPAVAVNIGKMSSGKVSTVQIIGYGTNAADETCDWILYTYRSLYSPAIRVATGTAILGTNDCVKDPVTNTAITDGFYVDDWGVTTDYWGSVVVKDTAQDGCSILTFDMRGFTFLYLEIDIPAASQVASFGAAWSGV